MTNSAWPRCRSVLCRAMRTTGSSLSSILRMATSRPCSFFWFPDESVVAPTTTQAGRPGGAGRRHRILGQLGRERAVGALLVGLDDVAVRDDPAVRVDDGPAPQLADRSRPG